MQPKPKRRVSGIREVREVREVRETGRRRRGRQVLFFLGALVLLHESFRGADFALAAGLIGHAGVALVLLPLPFLMTVLLDARAMQTALDRLGHRASLHALAAARVATEAIHLTFPAGAVVADAMSPVLQSRRSGVPLAASIAALAVRKWLLVRAHGLYIFSGALVGFEFLHARSPTLPWFVLASAIVPFVASAIIGSVLLGGDGIARLARIAARLPFARLRETIATHVQAVDGDLRRVRERIGRFATARVTCGYLAGWLLEAVETMLILRVLGVRIGFTEVIAIEAGMSVLRSFAFVAPGGLGALELGYAAALGMLGVPSPAAVIPAFLLLRRAKELAFVVVGFTLLGLERKPTALRPEPRRASGRSFA